VPYDADLDHAIQVINRVGEELAEDPGFKDKIIDPPHVLRVEELGESWVVLKVIGDTMPIEQWGIMGELRLRLKTAFDREGIGVPFAQRTVHMVQHQEGAAAADASTEPAAVPPQTGGGRPDDVKLDDGD